MYGDTTTFECKYRCMGCKKEFTLKQAGPGTICTHCRYKYIEWLNFEELKKRFGW